MIPLPPQIANQFDTLLVERAISNSVRAYYRKWLRYYWDFCQKYQFDPACRKSLAPFLKKLQDKDQAEPLRKQAHNAIYIYYEMGLHSINEDQTIEVDSTITLGRKEPLNRDPKQTAVSIDRKSGSVSKRSDKPVRGNSGDTIPDCAIRARGWGKRGRYPFQVMFDITLRAIRGIEVRQYTKKGCVPFFNGVLFKP